MSKRNQRRKRDRYYLARPEKLDEVASRVYSLEICHFTAHEPEDCDECRNARKGTRIWANVSRGEETEVSAYVCENCLRTYVTSIVRDWSSYGTRAYWRFSNHFDQQYEIRLQWQRIQSLKRRAA